jgi:hypothetical protein
VRQPKGKRPLKDLDIGRSKNIRMDVGEIGWSGIDWINVAQDKNQWWLLGLHKMFGNSGILHNW